MTIYIITPGATSGAEASNSHREPEQFNPLLWESCCPLFSFLLCNVLQIVFVFCWPLCCWSFDLQFLIAPLLWSHLSWVITPRDVMRLSFRMNHSNFVRFYLYGLPYIRHHAFTIPDMADIMLHNNKIILIQIYPIYLIYTILCTQKIHVFTHGVRGGGLFLSNLQIMF